MKIAIPTRDGYVDSHFGHCAYYTIYEVDSLKNITNSFTMESPVGCGCKSNVANQMQEMGITVMLAGNMGQGAVEKLSSCNINVIKGCEGEVSQVIKDYLAGKLIDHPEVCEHHNCSGHGNDTSNGTNHTTDSSNDNPKIFKIDLSR